MNDKINMLLMTYSKYFPDESMMMIQDRFEAMDESKTSMLYNIRLKRSNNGINTFHCCWRIRN